MFRVDDNGLVAVLIESSTFNGIKYRVCLRTCHIDDWISVEEWKDDHWECFVQNEIPMKQNRYLENALYKLHSENQKLRGIEDV